MKNLKLMSILAGAMLVAAGCSSGSESNGSGGSQGSGGSNGSGGNGSGGSSSSSTGGATNVGTGGHSSGGSSSTGGTSSGGATGSGGSGSGGASASGGTTGSSSGGTTASGGATASGGKGGGAASTGGASVGGSSGGGSIGTQHWVGTWTASPYYDSANPPPVSLSNTVIRQIAHVSLGGSQIRVQFSNLQGNGSITISSSHIALCKAAAGAAVDSTIDTTTDKALAFSGMPSVTIAQGKDVWSDAIDFVLASQGNLTITTAFGSVPSQVTSHSGSRTTSYIQSGTNVTAASMTGSGVTTVAHWYAISGIDVMADMSAVGAVAIGDSITDGRGTDDNKNNRWTDILAARLQGNAATAKVAMMNQGIGATNLVGATPSAQGRFARDVLGQSGVKYAIVFDGVNDIGNGAAFSSLKTVYDQFISMAHAKGMLIFGATITPFGGNAYYTTAHESVRQQVNTYIKSGAFDGVLDFDAALTDGGNPPMLQGPLMTWSMMDGLHPGPAGYLKMGNSVDLTLFTK